MQPKLVPGNSAGTVTAYYVRLLGSARDEIDFEFLGNCLVSHILSTRIHAWERQQRTTVLFMVQPYQRLPHLSILWNPQNIIFSVDGTPIREFKNLESKGVAFPKNEAMRIYSSLWNADDLATRGGLVKTDWTQAPFTTSYRNFNAQACVWTSKGSSCSSTGFTKPSMVRTVTGFNWASQTQIGSEELHDLQLLH
ncbi:hypothetical protein L6164_023976 [Bauhinia variegata]|uniref:Uncharacterized protein n=1 Tax=Bauhinia variegata TaxID=167791 RepID=A0ACB9LWD8_BAUVA|nr:hypothetical protein L6164_023976 [Bauhinia variegata]